MKKGFLIFACLFILILVSKVGNGQNVTTIAGNGAAAYGGDGGPATAASLDSPSFIAFGLRGGFGMLYVDDAANNRMRQIKIGSIITCVAGDGVVGYTGDGGLATAAELNNPGGMAPDKRGNLYFAELNNGVVRKINELGVISTIGGNGGTTFSGDGGLATNASFNIPHNVAVDPIGNVYVCDQWNQCIRKIDTSGRISTVAGTPTVAGFGGDGGPATNALLSYPNYVRADTLGNLFITDNGNQRIRKVNAAGVISTIAGNGSVGFSGDGGQATNASLQWPGGIQFDSYGNIYIGDAYNEVVRVVEFSTGKIFTIAGTPGVAGFSGDGGPATAALFNKPSDIAVDDRNNIYVNDWWNNRIRKIVAIYPPLMAQVTEKQNAQLSFSPNPTDGKIQVQWSYIHAGRANVSLMQITGSLIFSTTFEINATDGSAEVQLPQLENGMYLLTVQTDDYKKTESIIISK